MLITVIVNYQFLPVLWHCPISQKNKIILFLDTKIQLYLFVCCLGIHNVGRLGFHTWKPASFTQQRVSIHFSFRLRREAINCTWKGYWLDLYIYKKSKSRIFRKWYSQAVKLMVPQSYNKVSLLGSPSLISNLNSGTRLPDVISNYNITKRTCSHHCATLSGM